MPTRKIEPFDPNGDYPLRQNFQCFSPYHNPPSQMVYPPGRYEHVCPSCKRRTVFTVRGITA